MGLDIEKQLIDKGYHYYKSFNDIEEEKAKQLAKQIRSSGYYSRVVEYSTSTAGIHSYAVWTKKKG